MKVISRFHYGNRAGVQVFTMEFAGDIAFRLRLMRLMGEAFFRMQDELQSGVVQAETLPELAGIVREYYGRVLRHYYKNDRPRGRLVIEEIKDYIRSHYMDEISLKQLANLAFVSPDHFSHLFKHETGENYKTFLTTVRMEHAEELLRHTDYRITEVAEKIGYRSTRAFVDAFRQRYSIGPTEYRRQKQRDDI